MQRMLYRQGLLLGLLIWVAGQLHAQTPCLFSGTFKSTNLEEVVKILSAHCNLSISYDPDLLSQYPVEYVRIEGKDWKETLNKAIGDRPVKLKPLGNERYVIVKGQPVTSVPKKRFGGYVREAQTGYSLAGAMVVLGNAADGLSNRGVISREDGYFELEYEPKGGDFIEIRFLGYHPQQFILSEAKAPLNIQLKPLAVELESVLVTGVTEKAFRCSLDQSGVALSPRNIDAISVLGEKDVFRTLQFVPGVSSTEESSNGLFIRGSTPDQNLVLLDGVPIYNTGHFFGMFHAFNADALARVQVARGGYNVSRGGAIAGLIEIDARPEPGDTFAAGISANLATTSAYVTMPFAEGRGAVMVAGRRSYSDILASPLYNRISGNVFQTGSIFADERDFEGDTTAEYSVDPISNFHDLHLKATYDLDDRSRISANFYNGRDVVTYRFFAEEPVFGFGRDSEERLRLQNLAGGLRYERDLRNQRKLEVSGYGTEFSGLFNNDQTVVEDTDTLFYGAGQDNRVRSWSLRSELTGENKWGDSWNVGIQLSDMISAFSLTENDEEDEESFRDSVRLRSLILAGWVGYTWTLGKKMTVVPGSRFTYYGLDERLFAEPRLQLRYDVNRRIRLNANAGLYEQFLNPVQINNSLKLGTEFLALASEDLGIGETRGFQGGIGASYLAPGIWVDLQFYAKSFTGLERYVRQFNAMTNSNDLNDLLTDGSGNAVGMDFFIRGHKGPWTGMLGYSMAEVIHYFPDLNQDEAFPADHDHLHELKLVQQVEVGKWEFSAMWVLASGKPFSTPTGVDSLLDVDGEFESLELRFDQLNRSRLPAYHRLDLNISRSLQLGQRVSGKVGVSVFNLYDRNNIRDRNHSVEYPDDPNDPLEIVRVDRELLGFSPNVFLRLEF